MFKESVEGLITRSATKQHVHHSRFMGNRDVDRTEI